MSHFGGNSRDVIGALRIHVLLVVRCSSCVVDTLGTKNAVTVLADGFKGSWASDVTSIERLHLRNN